LYCSLPIGYRYELVAMEPRRAKSAQADEDPNRDANQSNYRQMGREAILRSAGQSVGWPLMISYKNSIG
jgi:hypothetical protein